ncbi:HupE/UreJ family protein [Alcanivorax sp.]|jgi:urease accessory protein|uniref:HupE/UreJ family protein n=1 Tax=Alcanivorax sp. TaxID=1872427 RepID=UPI00258BC6DF|nr:HupE/UreJ family protein [Alcanivorax sp.]
MNNTKHKLTAAVITCGLAISPMAAMAHTGEGGHVHGGFTAGLMHPITGMDHLVALVLFGALLAGIRLQEKRFALIAAGVSLAAGFVGGVALGGHVAMEWLITASALLFAAALAFPAGSRGKAACVVAVLLGAHGWAHGVEMSGGMGGFAPGFFVSSMVLMVAGLVLGQQLQRIAPALRAIVAGGAALALMLLAG